MKNLYKTSHDLTKDMGAISRDILGVITWHPGAGCDSAPILTIAQSIGTMIANLYGLKSDLANQAKEEKT